MSDYESRAAAAALSGGIPDSYARTAGYSSAGDGGGALYKKVSATPSHPAYFTDQTGACFEMVYEGQIDVRALGAQPVVVTLSGGVQTVTSPGNNPAVDSATAINNALTFANTLTAGRGDYNVVVSGGGLPYVVNSPVCYQNIPAWTSGATYTPGQQVTVGAAIYKCVTAGSGTSTVKPTGYDTTTPVSGADGYAWLYLAQLGLNGIIFEQFYLTLTDDTAFQPSAQFPIGAGLISWVKGAGINFQDIRIDCGGLRGLSAKGFYSTQPGFARLNRVATYRFQGANGDGIVFHGGSFLCIDCVSEQWRTTDPGVSDGTSRIGYPYKVLTYPDGSSAGGCTFVQCQGILGLAALYIDAGAAHCEWAAGLLQNGARGTALANSAAAIVYGDDMTFSDPAVGSGAIYFKAAPAQGAINFSGNPDPGSSLTLNRTAITFVSGTPGANQVQLGVDIGHTMTNLVTFLNASSDINLSQATYGSSAPAGISSLNITATNAPYTAATLATNPSNGSTVNVSGVPVQFTTGTPATDPNGNPTQVKIGADAATTLANLVVFCNQSIDPVLSCYSYSSSGNNLRATLTRYSISASYGTGTNSRAVPNNNWLTASPTIDGRVNGFSYQPILSATFPAVVSVVSSIANADISKFKCAGAQRTIGVKPVNFSTTGSGSFAQLSAADLAAINQASDDLEVHPNGLTLAIGNVTATDNVAGATVQMTQSYTVTSLPTAAVALKGTRAYVTDAASPTFRSPIAGGGSLFCPVICNGTTWLAG